jgi:hypothetical protein
MLGLHCNNVTAHNGIDSAVGNVKVKVLWDPTDELQVGDPGFEVDSGYFNGPRAPVGQCIG